MGTGVFWFCKKLPTNPDQQTQRFSKWHVYLLVDSGSKGQINSDSNVAALNLQIFSCVLRTASHTHTSSVRLPQEHPSSTSPIWGFTKQHATSEVAPEFNKVSLHSMVDSLRDVQVQALKLGQCNDDNMVGASDLCNKLEEQVRTLRAWENGLRLASGELGPSHRSGKIKFDAKKLYLCLRHVAMSCKFHIRAIDSLLSTINSFLQMSLPSYLATMVIHQVENTPMPKKSTLHVYELDVALMVLLRDKTEKGGIVARYLLSDSSPVAGQDWLWSQYAEISIDDVLEVFNAVLSLQAYGDPSDDAGDQEHHAERRRLHDVIKTKLVMVVNTPVALAPGCRSLPHKVAHLAYSIALHTAPGHMQKVMDAVVSHTSDMGVELGIPDFTITSSLNELLPPWLDVEPLLPYALDDCAGEIEEDNDIAASHTGEQEREDLLGGILSGGDDESEGVVSESAFLPPRLSLSPEPRVDHQQPPQDHVLPPTPPQVTPSKFMSNGLTIAGFQHITNNLCNDVHTNLVQWEGFYEQLKNIAGLVCSADRRKQYIWTCLRDTEYAFVEEIFAKYPMSVSLYEKRWSAVLGFLKALEDFLPYLTVSWNATKYSAQSKNRQQAAAPQFSPTELSLTLSSPRFHLYAKMALALERIGPKLSSFAESCPCHEHLIRGKTRAQRITFFEQLYGDGVRCCPCTAMMVPELVTGVVDAMVKESCADLRQELLCSTLPRGVQTPTDEDIRMVLDDLQRGQTTLCTLLALKTSYLKKLPWVLVGLASSSEDKARGVAQEAILQYDSVTTMAQHHPLSHKFLSPESLFRADLQKFVAGTRRSELSTVVKQEIAKLRFIYSAESTIEGKHAQVSLASRTVAIGPVRVSLTNRMHMLQCWLQCGHFTLEELVASFDKVRNLSTIASLLGLEQHPTIVHRLQDQRSGKLSQSAWRVVFAHIIYNVDLQSSFRDLTAIDRAHTRRMRQRKQDGEGGRKGLALFDVEIAAMRQHMLNQMALGEFYACPAELLTLTSLDTAAHSDSVDQPDPQSQDIPIQERAGNELVFFSMAVSQIGSKKTMFVPAGLSRQVAADDIAVTQHEAMEHVGEGSFVVRSRPLRTTRSQVPTWLCKAWTQEAHTRMKTDLLHFKSMDAGWWIDGLDGSYIKPSDLHPVLVKLLQVGATPAIALQEAYRSTGVGNEVIVLNYLHGQGLVENEGERWRLTPQAMQSLATTVRLADPQPLFARRPNTEVGDMDTWELMLQLSEQGWVWKRYISRGKNRTPASYKKDDPKVWFSTKVVSNRYMQCLLKADELFDQGLSHVPHRAKEDIYTRILEGDYSVLARGPVVMMDVEEAVHGSEDDEAPLEARAHINQVY